MTDTLADELISALEGPPPKDQRTRCYFKDWFDAQSPQRQQAISSAMANRKWKSVDLHRLFTKQGYERQYNTLRAHRSGTCSCG